MVTRWPRPNFTTPWISYEIQGVKNVCLELFLYKTIVEENGHKEIDSLDFQKSKLLCGFCLVVYRAEKSVIPGDVTGVTACPMMLCFVYRFDIVSDKLWFDLIFITVFN